MSSQVSPRRRALHHVVPLTPEASQGGLGRGLASLSPRPHKRARRDNDIIVSTPPSSGAPVDDEPGPGESAQRRPDFNIFQALMGRSDLLIEFFRRLDMPTIMDLYSISREFHNIVNLYFASFMRANAEWHGPEAADIFRFKLYRHLCRPDPVGRPNPANENETRLVPSFRWLAMVHQRERVVGEIIEALADDGHRMPRRTSRAIKKVWLTMDARSNYTRVGLIHNQDFWLDEDICLASLFFIKLDMRFLDPIDGMGYVGLRELLLGQKGLTVLWKALKREALTSYVELWQLFLRYAYVPPQQSRGWSIMGVPASEIGMGCRDLTVKTPEDPYRKPYLMRPDELVVREAIRRQMDLDKEYIEMMLWGYVDLDTYKDVETGETLDAKAREGDREIRGGQDNREQNDDADDGNNDDGPSRRTTEVAGIGTGRGKEKAKGKREATDKDHRDQHAMHNSGGEDDTEHVSADMIVKEWQKQRRRSPSPSSAKDELEDEDMDEVDSA